MSRRSRSKGKLSSSSSSSPSPLHGTVVSVSGFPTTYRNALRDRIEALGGEFQPNLTDEVDVMVCKHRLSSKAAIACMRNVPCVNEQWLTAIEDQLQSSEQAVEMPEYAEFAINLLEGAEISVTGVAESERGRIETLVHTHGGLYNGRFDPESFTHLLCAPNPTGPKIEAALQPGSTVHVCSVDWLYAFIESKGKADWQDFPVVRAHGSSEDEEEEEEEEEGGVGHGDEQQRSKQGTHTSNNDNHNHNNHNRDALHQQRLVHSEQALLTQREHAETTAYEASLRQRIASLSSSSSSSSSCDSYLECVELFVFGCSKAEQVAVSHVVRLSGCTRYAEWNHRVTHVVCGRAVSHQQKFKPELLDVAKQKNAAHVVVLEWLWRCAEQQELVTPTAELVLDLQTEEQKQTSTTQMTTTTASGPFSVMQGKRKRSDSSTATSNKSMEATNFGAFFQTLSPPTPVAASSSSASSSSNNNNNNNNNNNKRRKRTTSLSHHRSSSSSSSSSATASMFQGKWFVVMAFDTPLESIPLRRMIQNQLGGSILSDHKRSLKQQQPHHEDEEDDDAAGDQQRGVVVDYVVARALTAEIRAEFPFASVVTVAFVEHCAEQQKEGKQVSGCIPWTDLKFVTKPVLPEEKARRGTNNNATATTTTTRTTALSSLLRGHTISISGFERKKHLKDRKQVASLIALIEAMGGKASVELNTKQHTLMIVGEEGGVKQERAMEKNIPVVHVNWLYDSYVCMQTQPLDGYQLKKKQKQ